MQGNKTAIRPETLSSRGIALDLDLLKFGELVSAPDKDASHQELVNHLDKHGYLLMRGLFERQAVLDVRRDICRMLDEEGQLEPGTDPMDAVMAKDLQQGLDEKKGSSTHDRTGAQCQSMHALLYGRDTMHFFKHLLGGEALHYSLIWFRVVAPGFGTVPHCDIVIYGPRNTQSPHLLGSLRRYLVRDRRPDDSGKFFGRSDSK